MKDRRLVARVRHQGTEDEAVSFFGGDWQPVKKMEFKIEKVPGFLAELSCYRRPEINENVRAYYFRFSGKTKDGASFVVETECRYWEIRSDLLTAEFWY